jgi:hypothetical protein
MKLYALILTLSLTLVGTAFAETITVYNEPAGTHDTLHAKLALDRTTGRAYVRVFLVDESAYHECWGSQSVQQGMSTENCTVHVHKVALSGLAHDEAADAFTLEGAPVTQSALTADVHYVDIDDGVSINSVKHLRVRLEVQ